MKLSSTFSQVNGTRLCWFETGVAHPGRPSILLVHATGFHARCWDEVIRRLAGYHVISIDLRGHGRSDSSPPFSWDTFGSDLSEFIATIGLSNIVGAGHSMGGHCLVQAAHTHPVRFERLVLIDPVIRAPESYSGSDHAHDSWLDEDGKHPVSRRRNQFASAEDLYRHLRGRGGYAHWQDAVLRDYCNYGVLPSPDGDGVVLACPPDVEAAIYMGSADTNPHDWIPVLEMPVKVLRARTASGDAEAMDFSLSPTWPRLASCFSRGVDVYRPELTHYIPMQAPELTSMHILDHDFR